MRCATSFSLSEADAAARVCWYMLAAAALLLDDGINLIEVVRLLKERRPRCLTNKGFRLELVRKARRMNRLGPDASPKYRSSVEVLQGNRINTEDPDYEPPRRRARDGLFS